MTRIIAFMNNGFGRVVRSVLGLALIVYGVFVLGGMVGTLVAIIGLGPIALALWGHCLLEPFASRAHGAA